MADPYFRRLRRFLRELKRRNVYKVAATYAVVGFVLIQAADLIFPALNIPSWAYSLVVVLILFGFPIAIILAWAFEMTPEGVRRTAEAEPVEAEPEEAEAGTRTAYKVLVGVGLVAAAVAGGWYLTGGGGTTVSDRTVAVLPFETLGDTASMPFTEGLHNDLLTRLQRVSDLTVIARPSVMRYEGTDKPIAQVAEELKARWLVTAAVQSAGDQVRVQPRLIDPRKGTERWSNSYQRKLSADQVFAVQGEITRQIADALKAELAEGEEERLTQRPTSNLDAYRLYVQGRKRLARRRFLTHADGPVPEAVGFFQRAIRHDSTFALAWAGLADAAAVYPSGALDSVPAPSVDQEFAARRALELDPDLAEAQASMGYVYFQRQNAPAAIERLRRALDLNPNYWEAHNWLGGLYLRIGRAREAMDHLRVAVELNPKHARARHYLYDAHLALGRPEESLREVRRQQEMGLEPRSAVGGEVRALYHLGRYREARRLAQEQIATLEEGAPWREIFRSYLVIIHAAEGDTARAREVLTKMRSEDVRPVELEWVETVTMGWAHAALGETDRALEAFGRLSEEALGELGVSSSLRYGIHLDLEPFRGDPRFRKLMRKANRAWGLNPDGSLPDSVDVSFDSGAGRDL